MLILGSLAFASPWMLTALAALPALIWLMRVTPPAPQRIRFPAIRLLFGLHSEEETAARTPLWLLILRALVAALVIVALARPILNPDATLVGDGPVLLVVDDGWAAAGNWRARQLTMLNLVDQAGRDDRPVAVLTTAPPPDGGPIELRGVATAAEARDRVLGLQPKPWPADRAAAARALGDGGLEGPVEVFWLADGLAQAALAGAAPESDAATRALADALTGLGPVRMVTGGDGDLPLTLAPAATDAGELRFEVRRAGDRPDRTVWIRASADRGQILSRIELALAAGEAATAFNLDLPPELRNRVVRIEIEQQDTAGAVILLDERWRRRPVGIVAGDAVDADRPLLSALYYLDRALSPFAEVRTGTIPTLLDRELSVLALADVGKIVGPVAARLEQWLSGGGVLVRFAGPRMAQDNDDLLPARLRPGERSLGGAMTWSEPALLAPFPETSPFRGLDIPADVQVNRQVLAEPTLDIGEKTWARLADGTPLVTGARHGNGWIVLFHTTANTDWSNLPLSGLFVEMLRTIVRLSQGIEGQPGEVVLPPLSSLDGFGRLAGPGPAAQPLPGDAFATTMPGPRAPPGFYGADDARQAFNLGAALAAPVEIAGLPSGISRGGLSEERERDLMPWLLTAAIVLALVEFAASLQLRGLLRPGAAAAAVVLAVAGGGPPPASAQNAAENFAMAAALETRLAWVITTNGEVDRLSELGLLGLTRVMSGRTAVEAAYPVGVDPERHELAFFPLLYWPMTPEQPALSPAALANVDAFLKNGGTILFDTRDQRDGGFGGGGAGTATLRRILAQLDVPPLVPVPPEHVLTQAFYLMDQFPGRYEGSPVWVEQHVGGVNDGVSSLVIGANDWAAAWALDEDGWPLAAVSSNDERQRELAFRFGINLVMYTLTGSYKADQVHLPAIMERLGE